MPIFPQFSHDYYDVTLDDRLTDRAYNAGRTRVLPMPSYSPDLRLDRRVIMQKVGQLLRRTAKTHLEPPNIA